MFGNGMLIYNKIIHYSGVRKGIFSVECVFFTIDIAITRWICLDAQSGMYLALCGKELWYGDIALLRRGHL